MPSTAIRTFLGTALGAACIVLCSAAVVAAPPPDKGGGGGKGKPSPTATASPSPTGTASPAPTATAEPVRTSVRARDGYELAPTCLTGWDCAFGHRYPWVEVHSVPVGSTIVFTADATGKQICTAPTRDATYSDGRASCTQEEWDAALEDLSGAGTNRNYTATYAGDAQHLPSSGSARMTDSPVSVGMWRPGAP